MEHRHCRARFWLPNCFTALARVRIYIDARRLITFNGWSWKQCVLLGGERDTLCVLWEAAKRMNFVRMPCIWHCGWKMAWKEMLRTHGRDVVQWMERPTHGQQRAENPLAATEVVPEAGELLGVSSTRLAPGGEENSSDPNMIGYSHSSHKINQQH